MIKVPEISLPVREGEDNLLHAAAKKIGVAPSDIRSMRLLRRSVDARHRNDIRYTYTLLLDLGEREASFLKRNRSPKITEYFEEQYEIPRIKPHGARPVVIGFVPGGIFAALLLAQAGLCPIVFERGGAIEERSAAVRAFRSGGRFSASSNIQFGEGGAGTFSDGKLNTGVNDPRIRRVFEEFVEAGAPGEILYDAKPHIGTDLLPGIVKRLREKIITLGGEVCFDTKLCGLTVENGVLTQIEIMKKDGVRETVPVSEMILAIGHSARDTFSVLHKAGIAMDQKSFSVGARIEHPQELIDRGRYGDASLHKLIGAADYRLSEHLPNGRGVYTFCMCPGGEVVCASSEENGIVTNGMSEYARARENANAALLVGVGPGDFGSDHPLAGVEFQRKIEMAAFELSGSYLAPAQRVEDFLKKKASAAFSSVRPSYLPGVIPSSLDRILPEYVADSMRQGILRMDRKLPGFAFPDAVLTGPETRSSSPVRILRGENLESVSARGLYPCAEGAGYAGGITSAAMDGLRCAEKIIDKYRS